MNSSKTLSPRSTSFESKSIASHSTYTTSPSHKETSSLQNPNAQANWTGPALSTSQDGSAAHTQSQLKEAQRAVQRALQTHLNSQSENLVAKQNHESRLLANQQCGNHGPHIMSHQATPSCNSADNTRSIAPSEPSVEEHSGEHDEAQQAPGGKTASRKKIKIQLIRDPRSRQVTFLKRKNGLMKKAMELSVLCNCEVAVIVYNNNNGKMFEYSSHQMEQTMYRYATYNGPFERRRTERFYDLAGAKTNANIPLNEPHLAQAALDAATAAAARPRPAHRFDSTTSGGEVRVSGKRLSPPPATSPGSPARRGRWNSNEPTGQGMYMQRAHNGAAHTSVQMPTPQLPQPQLQVPHPTPRPFTPSLPLPSTTPRTAGRHLSSLLGVPSTQVSESAPVSVDSHSWPGESLTQPTWQFRQDILPPPWQGRQRTDTLPHPSEFEFGQGRSSRAEETQASLLHPVPREPAASSPRLHQQSGQGLTNMARSTLRNTHNSNSSTRLAPPPALQVEAIEPTDPSPHNTAASALPTPPSLTAFLNMDLYTPRIPDPTLVANTQYSMPSPPNSSMLPLTPRGMGFETLLTTPYSAMDESPEKGLPTSGPTNDSRRPFA